MMEAKQYIRQYEELKNQEPNEDLQSIQQMERKWMKLVKDMSFGMKSMTKKQRLSCQPFKEKSVRELKKYSASIFQKVTNVNGFGKLVNKHEHVYFKTGSKGLIELYLKETNSDVNYEEKVGKIRRFDALKNETTEQWLEKVNAVLKERYTTLSEAYQIEQRLILLFKWFEIHKKVAFQEKGAEQVYGHLTNYHHKMITFMIEHLGYNLPVSAYFATKRHKAYLREKGLLKTMQILEQEIGFVSPMVKELAEDINIVSPSQEFQHVRAMKRHFIIHTGPTNSGKTYHAIEALKQADTGVYLAPIRLLALEIQEKLTEANLLCELKTGDEEILIRHATHQASTIEITPFHKPLQVAVIDEMQMIEDPTRGHAWLRAIFGLQASEIHLCGASYALPFIQSLIEECGDTMEVRHYDRQTSLVVEEEPYTFPHSTKKGDALIAFSKKRVMEIADELQQAGYKVSVMYGKLPPQIRKQQVERFIQGETDVIVTTDTIGIGLNLPIKRVVFLETTKFDGYKARHLSIQEVKQIAGRAGRKGLYEQGYVNATTNKDLIVTQLTAQENPICKSVLTPSREILQLEKGTLRQRLLAWQEAALAVPYLEKANIEVPLTLLRHIEQWEHELDIAVLVKTLQLSFDYKNDALLQLWKKYVEELKNQQPTLTKPSLAGKTFAQLETYHQSIGLYEQFSKKFNLSYSRYWSIEEKNRISRMFHQHLSVRY